jgi:hypothetical protein
LLHANVKFVALGESEDVYGPLPATVPAMAAVKDASVHVAGVVNGVAYAGGLPDHVPLAVDGEQDWTDEQPIRYTEPGVPGTLADDGAAAISAEEEKATPAVVLVKLEPPLPPKA